MILLPTPNKYRECEKMVNMRFQGRDDLLLQTIYNCDGVIARRHIKDLFWPTSTLRPMERRLSKLFHAEYINWPSRQQRKTKAIPEPICWLGWKGAHYLVGKSGIDVEPPNRANENQLRMFQRRLRKNGFGWFREPRWHQLEHDLAVVDFRFLLERSVTELPSLSLIEWINESSFRSETDVVEYEVKKKGERVSVKKRGICPDGYFVIGDRERQIKEQPHKARFLLELDMASHDNPSFGVEKIAAGAAYIKHSLYKARFGSNSGRWLVITTGEVRMRNLMRQTSFRVGSASSLFFFTTFNRQFIGNVLTSPIWWQVGIDHPIPLISDVT